LRAMVGNCLEQFKITMMEWLLLGVVGEAPKEGITLSHIADALDVSQPQVSALMDEVLSQRLVRQKVNKKDRRSRTVALTPKRARLVERIEAAITNHLKEWLAEIPKEQLQAYLNTIRFITESEIDKPKPQSTLTSGQDQENGRDGQNGQNNGRYKLDIH